MRMRLVSSLGLNREKGASCWPNGLPLNKYHQGRIQRWNGPYIGTGYCKTTINMQLRGNCYFNANSPHNRHIEIANSFANLLLEVFRTRAISWDYARSNLSKWDFHDISPYHEIVAPPPPTLLCVCHDWGSINYLTIKFGFIMRKTSANITSADDDAWKDIRANVFSNHTLVKSHSTWEFLIRLINIAQEKHRVHQGAEIRKDNRNRNGFQLSRNLTCQPVHMHTKPYWSWVPGPAIRKKIRIRSDLLLNYLTAKIFFSFA